MIIVVILFIIIGITTLAYVRIIWVSNVRLELIENNYEKYLALMSYEKMFFKFWIWDIAKFEEQKTTTARP